MEDIKADFCQVLLSPLVLKNISEHAKNSEQPAVGAIVGQKNGGYITISNSFELKLLDNEQILDLSNYLRKEKQYKEISDINHQSTILGWYKTSNGLRDFTENDIKLHDQMFDIWYPFSFFLLVSTIRLQESNASKDFSQFPVRIYDLSKLAHEPYPSIAYQLDHLSNDEFGMEHKMKLHSMLKDMEIAIDPNAHRWASEIQEWISTQFLEGHDMCILSANGQGKTTAAIASMMAEIQPNDFLQAIYFCVTFDATIQAVELIRKACGNRTEIKWAMVAPSIALPPCEDYNIIVGTPNDIIKKLDHINIQNIKTVFFDDGDLTFASPKIQQFVQRIGCRIVYLSSTIKDSVLTKLRSMAMASPKIFRSPSVKSIAHYCEIVSNVHSKISLFKQTISLLKIRALVFCKNREQASLLFEATKNEMDVILFSGDLDLTEREWRLQSFANGIGQLLITTDVLSRAISLTSVKCVVHFSVPSKNPKGDVDLKGYMNRIGRVGSLGQTVVSLSYVRESEFVELNEQFLAKVIHE